MKRFFRLAGLVLISMAMLTPTVDARGRNNSGDRRSPQHSQTQTTRPGNMGRPTQNASRPGNNHGVRPGNNGNNRPGNTHGVRPGNNGNSRPGNTNGVRPGNNGNNHPGNNHGVRPGNNWNNPGGRPGHVNQGRPHNNPSRPGHGPSHFGHRPTHIPHFAGWHRPAPPRYWRPAPQWRPFRSILGIALGTSFGLSINALMNNGYNVNYYGDNTIYLNDATMLNMLWPDAVLYYNGGGLCGSRFIYTSPYYDMNRYNLAFTTLANTYGNPASIQNTSAGIEATWWGTGNQFIRLSYMSDYAQNGSLCYFTTLSFGN